MMTVLICTIVSVNHTWAKGEKEEATGKSKKANGISMSALGKIDAASAPTPKNEIKDEMADHAALYAEPSKVKMTFSCKTASGQELKQGEVGYDECLRNVKNEQFNKANKKSGTNSSLPTNGENATIKVEFGK